VIFQRQPAEGDGHPEGDCGQRVTVLLNRGPLSKRPGTGERRPLPCEGTAAGHSLPRRSGASLMLRNSIGAPSDCNRIFPFVASAFLPSLASLPLTTRRIVLPRQVISYLFQSPGFFSTGLSLSMRSKCRGVFLSCRSLSTSSLKPSTSQKSPAWPAKSCASTPLGQILSGPLTWTKTPLLPGFSGQRHSTVST